MFVAPSREFFQEPAVENPPERTWRDWALVGALLIAAICEWLFNEPLIARTVHIGVVVVLIPTVLWRRTHPLLMMAIVFVAMNVLLVLDFFFAEIPEGPYTAIFIVVLIYAVFRWGSGRDCVIVIGLVLVGSLLNLFIDYNGVGEAIGGMIFVFIPAELGVLVRFQKRSAEQAITEVRSSEREQIARELHDSVAHHVSAIAVQAQAGRAVAAKNPAAAAQALEAIEEAAARTLSDMRSMVGSLRGDAELAPQQGLADISSLAGSTSGLLVTVDPLPENEGTTAVGAALFRIAQESVTNAVRHAQGATRVDVRVTNGDGNYTLTVTNDGRPTTLDNRTVGYGLIGMSERARLLGGTLDAGPSNVAGKAGGWRVEAVLPMNGISK